MEEYSLAGNRNFNYTIYMIDQEGTGIDRDSQNLKAMAEDYGIPSIQIQNVERDEVSLQNAYMGMVLIQGDLVETIPALAKVSNLEYRITSVINKISRKTNTLLAMKDSISVELILSPELVDLSKDLSSYPEEFKDLVEKLNRRNFDRLEYRVPLPDDYSPEELGRWGLNRITLQTGVEGQRDISAYAGVVIRYGEESRGINLLSKNLFGFSILSTDDLEHTMEQTLERMIGVNQSIGYLSDHNTVPFYTNPYTQQQSGQTAGNFYRLESQDYNLEMVSLEDIPENIQTLIINGPKEDFTDWELFQLDQFIMKGGSIALFLDAFNQEIPSQQQMLYGQMPRYTPLHTGLEKLLSHYGAELKKSFVMDENCYVQQRKSANGGISQTPLYFAPKISRDQINKELPFMNNINSLFSLNISPLQITAEENEGVKASVVLRSSSDAWTVEKDINLYNPAAIIPPGEEMRGSQDLAVLLEGSFTSYFNALELPEPPQKESAGNETAESQDILIDRSDINHEKAFIPETNRGSIFVAGSSEFLSDSLIDEGGASPNATFVQNVIDHLNGREDYAVMRSKGQGYNPLPEVDNRTRAFLKGLNIAVLPILVILAGLVVWSYRNARKRKIQRIYE